MSRILIVEDKEENLYYLSALLKGHGYEVEAARHGAEALTMARRQIPDMVVSDLLMPVMDGYTLLRHWKLDARLKDVPFIVYTATYTEEEDRQLALKLGADAFILKPAEPEVFLLELETVFAAVGSNKIFSKDSPQEEDTDTILKSYSETLIRKLEEKMIQLEETNKALEADIAKRQEMEQSLRETELRFNQLAENINEVFWLSDPDKRIMYYVSSGYERIWGRSRESLYQSPRTWLEAIHPEDRQRIDEASRQEQALGNYEEMYRIIRPDGSIRWIRDKAFPVLDDSGKVYRIAGTAEDITEHRLAILRIKEQAALIDKTQDAIIVKDLDGVVIFWNASAERIYGWTRDEITGKRADSILFKEKLQMKEAQEILLKKGEWIGELRQQNKDGSEVLIEGRWTLLKDEKGNPKSILAVNTDITERKKIEAQFLRVQRLESIGTLAGGIAHDLNNVLSPIIMGLDLIRQNEEFPEHLYLILDSMARSARRGTDLVKQVLSFARGLEVRKITLQLEHVVREVESIIENTFPKNISFGYTPSRNLALISGDPTQLHQVILNLCLNARDAMEQGGHLHISTRNVTLSKQNLDSYPECQPGPYVCLEVRDEGVGMTPEIKEKLFEPFFTTKETGKGTGLGLPTVLGIVRSHSGFITVYSEPGQGTAFHVYLPAKQEVDEVEAFVAHTGPLPEGNGECILVVDDEEAILNVTKDTLETFGYTVFLAGNGAEAVKLFSLHRDKIDLVLTDMMMPVMDGPELVMALQQINPDVKVVACSGLEASRMLSRASGAGVSVFLTKPFTAESLLTTVHEALHFSAENGANG